MITHRGIPRVYSWEEVKFELYALNKANQGIKKIQDENGYDGIIETFKKTTDVTTLTAFTEDLVALIGIILALIGIIATKILENPIFDATTSLIIGILLMFVAVALAWENKRLLLGESMEYSDEKHIKDIIKEFDSVSSVIDIKTLYFGPKAVLVTAHIEFNDDASVKEVENTTDKIEKRLRETHSDIKTVYIEPKS